MIFCPNCNHENPEGATSCEACLTALPATRACPTCGASVQLDAKFCGQCGQNFNPAASTPASVEPVVTPAASSGLPPTVLTSHEITIPPIPSTEPAIAEAPEIPSPVAAPTYTAEASTPTPSVAAVEPPAEAAEGSPLAAEIASPAAIEIPPTPIAVSTQIQQIPYQLIHVQTNTNLEIPPQLQVIHIGKPNDQVPPDIDVSGFPSAEVVSRIHANILVEAANYYIEDIGSANGTYINHNILAKGNRHLLQLGDRIGLGKGDLVTFIFQVLS